MAPKYDPVTARDLFVVHDKGIREIAREMGVSPASISSRSHREDWEGQRLVYRSSVARRSYENMADAVANERGEILKENVLAARATVRKYLKDLAEGKVSVTARDAEMMMRFLVGEMSPGDSANTIDHSAPGARDVTPPDTDFLRRLVDMSRSKVAPPKVN